VLLLPPIVAEVCSTSSPATQWPVTHMLSLSFSSAAALLANASR
jgi:hypothetical protein